MLLNNQWANEEIKGKIKKYLEKNENGNTAYQNIWCEGKAVLNGRFIVIQAYLKKQEKYQTKFTPKGTRRRKTNAAQS